jgi:hypothetical protein
MATQKDTILEMVKATTAAQARVAGTYNVSPDDILEAVKEALNITVTNPATAALREQEKRKKGK